MRLVYFDIDTLRPDHLGCYGYHRRTSPHIDALAADGFRFDNVYASDTPCLPSRTALMSGQLGIRNGAVNHGGARADPYPEGRRRGFQSSAALHTWTRAMRQTGMWTASFSTFAERHSAYHFDAGFNECFNLGTRGLETADQVAAAAGEWLNRNAHREHWFLHVHMWDPHTPYRTPPAFDADFTGDPLPGWLTDEVRAAHWRLPGPHSAQEMSGFGPRSVWDPWPLQPQQACDMDQVRRMFDGYDLGVRYADHHVGRLLGQLDRLGVMDDTAVMVSSDHGESLGELGVYCDHQTADQHTTRLPCVLRWPGLAPHRGLVDPTLHYQIDVAATVLELLGAPVPDRWDGASFAAELTSGTPAGRDHLVLSHAAWTAQRSVRFDDLLLIRTFHDGFHGYPEVMLFDLVDDPHEQRDLAPERPADVARALGLLHRWEADARHRSPGGADPLWSVIAEGGPWHSRGHFEPYMAHLRATGRSQWAQHFEQAMAADGNGGHPAARSGAPARQG